MCNVLYAQVIGKWNERLLLNVSDVVWAQVLVCITWLWALHCDGQEPERLYRAEDAAGQAVFLPRSRCSEPCHQVSQSSHPATEK